MKFLTLLSLILFTSCGKDYYYSSVKSNNKEGRESFSGYYLLDGPSTSNCIRLDEKIENIVDIEVDCQQLVTTNPENGTLGQFPKIIGKDLPVVRGEIRLVKNINYSRGNDIEEDVSGSDIIGKRRTDVLVQRVNGKLQIRIDIYKNSDNNNLNEVVATRIFKEQ